MWSGRHLLTMDGADAGELRALLERAKAPEASDALAGRTVANVFFEDSTRTRVSFSLAAQSLGARVVDWTAKGSSVSKGESLVDTFWTIESMGVDVVVVRHPESGSAKLLADNSDCVVVNAGDGAHQHPTQALTDAFTLGAALGVDDGWDFSDRRVAIVGDCVSSRVARSNAGSLRALGAEVVLVGPAAMAPVELGDAMGCSVSDDLDAVLESVDAAMMLRVQLERGAGELMGDPGHYHRGFGLTRERADAMMDHAVVMHPGPMNRGVEIEGVVADGERSVIRAQVRNGVRVRAALLAGAVERAS